MRYPFRLRTSFCALSVCVLSACGGGGDDVAATSQSTGKSSVFVQQGDGDAFIKEGAYTLDTNYVGAAGIGTLAGADVEWLDFEMPAAAADKPPVKGQLIYSKSNTAQYAISIQTDPEATVDESESTERTVYACRGSVAWGPDQLAYLTAGTVLDDLPVCGGAIALNAVKNSPNRGLKATSLKIPKITAGGTGALTFTSEASWVISPGDPVVFR